VIRVVSADPLELALAHGHRHHSHRRLGSSACRLEINGCLGGLLVLRLGRERPSSSAHGKAERTESARVHRSDLPVEKRHSYLLVVDEITVAGARENGLSELRELTKASLRVLLTSSRGF
jgi:hypothetical protein